MSTDQKLELNRSILDRLGELNKKYRSLNVHDRIDELYHDFDVSEKGIRLKSTHQLATQKNCKIVWL